MNRQTVIAALAVSVLVTGSCAMAYTYEPIEVKRVQSTMSRIWQAYDATLFEAQSQVARISSYFNSAKKTENVVEVQHKQEPVRHITLSEIKQKKLEKELAQEEPASGTPATSSSAWKPETDMLTIDAILTPQTFTVISSSQDGRIADVPLDNGDSFKKDDILVKYDCADLEAEAEMAGLQKDLTKKKAADTNQLFKLDIISDVERLNSETEDKQADAKLKIYKARLDACTIRAAFDGHVTKRLANTGEYTRTDRVLMEVASDEPLQAEFLAPSKWLRWVNVGAPVTIAINETEKTYTAKVTRVYGAIDPVSQSIQMRATLDNYSDILLPGMSGKITLSVAAIEKAGVKGFLQAKK